jgi:hypothetical protein
MCRERINTLGVKRALFFVLLSGLVFIAKTAESQKDSRLSQRPAVATPACKNPKPYSSWTPGAASFLILFAVAAGDSVTARDRFLEAARETKRLSEKYKIEDHGPISFSSEPDLYVMGAEWLEPEQVAALRCESSVVRISFLVNGASTANRSLESTL